MRPYTSARGTSAFLGALLVHAWLCTSAVALRGPQAELDSPATLASTASAQSSLRGRRRLRRESFSCQLDGSDSSARSKGTSKNGVRSLPLNLRSYRTRYLLDRGSSASVWSATKKDGTPVAIKAFNRESESLVSHEVAIMRHLSDASLGGCHESVIELLEDFSDEDDKRFIVLEYAAGGSLIGALLSGKINAGIGADTEVLRSLFRQVVDGVYHMHSRGVAHRDLKPDNILLVQPGNGSQGGPLSSPLAAKIADFGLSAQLQPGERRNDPCGSRNYAAPEIWQQRPYRFEPDIWALGVTLYVMIVGGFPFDGSRLQYEVAHAEPNWPHWDKAATEVLRGMLAKDMDQRWTVEMIRDSSFYMGTDYKEARHRLEAGHRCCCPASGGRCLWMPNHLLTDGYLRYGRCPRLRRVPDQPLCAASSCSWWEDETVCVKTHHRPSECIVSAKEQYGFIGARC